MNDEFRIQTGRDVKSALEAAYEETGLRVWFEEEKIGPLGGVQTSILAIIEREGRLTPLGVIVYSDDRILEEIETRATEERRDSERSARLREALGWDG